MVKFTFILSDKEYFDCENFAINSAKTQRENRSGGTLVRSIEFIASDTLRGKVAEVLAIHFFAQEPFRINNIPLDFNVYPRGKWDDQDLKINQIRIAIKSAKWFSKWLLLETKDIERGDTYDFYIFIVVAKDYKSGTIMGYVTKEEIINDPKTLKLKKGEYIPGTSTALDANNYARHYSNLHNSEEEWIKFIKKT